MPAWTRRLLILFFLLPAALASLSCSQKHYATIKGDTITLYYENSEAKAVSFAYSLDHFRYHPARIGKSGTWEVSVLASDEFSYFYVVDGRIAVPECDFLIHDDFGSHNCLFPLNM